MEIETIRKIREKIDSLRKKIKDTDLRVYDEQTYGGENEYNFKDLVVGIKALLTDLSTLTKAPGKFVKISIRSERINIVNYLIKIETHFKYPENYLGQFEALKILLRGYNVRNFSERQIEFKSEIEKTSKIKIQLQQELVEVKK